MTIRRKYFRAVNYRGGAGQRIIAMGKIGHTELTVTSRRVWASETSVSQRFLRLARHLGSIGIKRLRKLRRIRFVLWGVGPGCWHDLIAGRPVC